MILRLLSAAEVVRALPMAEAIAGMKEAFAEFSAGRATVPLRPRIEVPEHAGVSLFMPAYVAGDLAIKVVSVFGNNPARNLPLIYAVVLVLESGRGPCAVAKSAEQPRHSTTGSNAAPNQSQSSPSWPALLVMKGRPPRR